eukprot:m.6207 g.6207  ORF g.6207 m.6207 type:complete len:321 (+) comp3497_c0_seq2:52-1014(+)
MKAIFASFLVSLLLQGSNATSIYMMDGSKSVGPGETGHVLRVDTTTKNATLLPSGVVDDEYDFVSGAVKCGSMYYSVMTDMTTFKFGMGQYNLDTKEFNLMDTPVLYHFLMCDTADASGNSLYAVGSSPGKPTAQFSFRKYDATTQNDTLVGNFPLIGWSGQDTIFTADTQAQKVYAAFPEQKGFKRSTVCEMDMSGKVTQYEMKPLAGFIYYMGVVSGGFKAAIYHSSLPGDVQSLKYADLKLSNGVAEISNMGNEDVMKQMFGGGMPLQLCNNTIFSYVTGSKILYGLSPDDASVQFQIDTTTFPLAKGSNPGAIACA